VGGAGAEEDEEDDSSREQDGQSRGSNHQGQGSGRQRTNNSGGNGGDDDDDGDSGDDDGDDGPGNGGGNGNNNDASDEDADEADVVTYPVLQEFPAGRDVIGAYVMLEMVDPNDMPIPDEDPNFTLLKSRAYDHVQKITHVDDWHRNSKTNKETLRGETIDDYHSHVVSKRKSAWETKAKRFIKTSSTERDFLGEVQVANEVLDPLATARNTMASRENEGVKVCHAKKTYLADIDGILMHEFVQMEHCLLVKAEKLNDNKQLRRVCAGKIHSIFTSVTVKTFVEAQGESSMLGYFHYTPSSLTAFSFAVYVTNHDYGGLGYDEGNMIAGRQTYHLIEYLFTENAFRHIGLASRLLALLQAEHTNKLVQDQHDRVIYPVLFIFVDVDPYNEHRTQGNPPPPFGTKPLHRYYQGLGFKVVPKNTCPPSLRAIFEDLQHDENVTKIMVLEKPIYMYKRTFVQESVLLERCIRRGYNANKPKQKIFEFTDNKHQIAKKAVRAFFSQDPKSMFPMILPSNETIDAVHKKVIALGDTTKEYVRAVLLHYLYEENVIRPTDPSYLNLMKEFDSHRKHITSSIFGRIKSRFGYNKPKLNSMQRCPYRSCTFPVNGIQKNESSKWILALGKTTTCKHTFCNNIIHAKCREKL